jgi:hypothetical protein
MDKLQAFLFSAVRQHPPHLFHIRSGNDLIQTKRPFPFGTLFGQNMAGVGFSELIFPGAGFFEPLCRSSGCLDFRHRASPCPLALVMYYKLQKTEGGICRSRRIYHPSIA